MDNIYKIAFLIFLSWAVFTLADQPVVDEKIFDVSGDSISYVEWAEVQRVLDETNEKVDLAKSYIAELEGVIAKIENRISMLAEVDRDNDMDAVFGSVTPTSGHIFIANGGKFYSKAVSGNGTIDSDGVLDIVFADSAGSAVDTAEFIDSVLALKGVMRDTATVVWNDSASVMRTYVQVTVEDSLDEYSTYTVIQALIADSLDEYSLTTWIQGQIDDLNDRIDSVITNCCP